MRVWGWIICAVMAANVSGPVLAQETPIVNADESVLIEPVTEEQTQTKKTAIQVPVIAFDRERIFSESDLGRALEAKIETLLSDLVSENDAIFAALEAEEQELTALKGVLRAEDFAKKADAFDAKVVAKRAEQKAKSETIQQTKDQSLREFETALNAVLTDIAQEVRAVAVFERGQIYLMSGSIDISLEAVKRLNANSQQSETPAVEATGQDSQPTSEDQ